MTQFKSFRESLAAAAERAAQKPTQAGFWGQLSEDERQQLLEVRAAWRSGAYGLSASKFAVVLVEQCREAGIEVCGPQGMRSWLTRND